MNVLIIVETKLLIKNRTKLYLIDEEHNCQFQFIVLAYSFMFLYDFFFYSLGPLVCFGNW